jgi:hypothetical protein
MGLLVFLWLWQLYGPTINPDTAKIEGMIQQQFPEAARVNCRSLGNDGFGGTRWGCKATVGGQRGPWFVGFHNSLGWNVREAYPDDRW